jgi:hypothetical protein
MIQQRDDDEKIIHDVLEEVISFVNADDVCHLFTFVRLRSNSRGSIPVWLE